jgi:hypothetical protein
MATNNKWERWEHYQKYGVYPETVKQQKAREAKARDVADNGPTEQVHPAASQQLSNAPKVESTEEPKEDFVSKVVREWWERHPHLKNNDNPPT